MSNNTMRPECDITRTQILANLFATPREQRDAKWEKDFFANVETASFAAESPQVVSGPDGFPYFVLRTPEPMKPFESFCIRNMMEDFLLEHGWGVAINPVDTTVDWVFSYGDIVNLHLNKEFYTKTGPVEIDATVTLSSDDKILISQPAESYLPAHTRANIKKYLQYYGVAYPKIMMLTRESHGSMLQELVFSVYPEHFSSTDEWNNHMKRIAWFLPRHYIIASVPKESKLTDHYADL